MKLWKIGTFLMFSFTVPLFAQEDAEQPKSERLQRLLQRFDKDGDGQLSDEERAAARETLQGQEAEQRRGEREGATDGRPGPGGPGFLPNAGQIFEQLDQNKDGKISKDELGERGQRLAQADANSDGEITKEELQTALARMREQAARAFDPEQLFVRFDQNSDGKLTKEELGERGQWVLQSDGNSDGEVTKEEFQAAAARMREQAARAFDPEQMFARMDQNGDGKLQKDEVRGPLAERVAEIDADKDGEISKEEYRAAAGRLREFAARAFNPEQLFARIDQNGDGKLQKDELRGPLAERAAEIDGDMDGEISKGEFQAAGERLRGLFGGGPGGPPRIPSVDETFARFDKDNDGKLTKEELPEPAAERILQADSDSDGAVTKDELRAARERLGPPRGERRPGDRKRPPADGNN